MRLGKVVVVTILVVLAGSCAYRGGDDPVSRNLSWFSYLNGDDIRTACGPEAGDRYRFVYNGVFVEQIRTYDIAMTGADDSPVLNLRVIGAPNIIGIDLISPFSLLDPWRGTSETVNLQADDLRHLRAVMQEYGVFAGAPAGLQLHSENFYWIVAACNDGRFFFNAYRWPSQRFERASFPILLAAWDVTEIPFNPPRKVDPFELFWEPEGEDMSGMTRFNLAVGDDGLIGVSRLF